jgi:maleylacetoacetate isomerase/maleylpyruvate isomerase
LLNNGGEQHSPEYRKLNPQGEIPTLVHDNKVIAQSFAIIEYLDEVFSQNPLFPKDPYTRAKIRQFCENINAFIHPLSNLKVLQYLEKNQGYDQKQKEAWVQHWAHQGLQATEILLRESSGEHCFGDQVTAADLFLIPQVFSVKRFGVQLDNYPLIQKMDATASTLEAFQKAHPFRQIDTPADVRIP